MEANGVECIGCGSVAEGSDLTSDCEDCGSEVMPVRIEPCPLGLEVCADDAHHFGRGDHVTTIER